MNSDYKKYSLENLKIWVQDALTSAEASPQEIYDAVKNAVQDEYDCSKKHTNRCRDLLSLLYAGKKDSDLHYDSNKYTNLCLEIPLTCDRDDPSPECKKSWTSFWEDSMPPWGHSDLEALRYTEDELNAMCDKAASDEEKEKCREYNLREAEYYNKRAELDLKEQVSRNDPNRLDYKSGYIYESPDNGKTVYARNPGGTERILVKEERVNKWVLPVDVDGLTGDCFVNLPDDLLKLADLKEGDEVEWVDKKDGTYILRKATKTIKMEEC